MAFILQVVQPSDGRWYGLMGLAPYQAEEMMCMAMGSNRVGVLDGIHERRPRRLQWDGVGDLERHFSQALPMAVPSSRKLCETVALFYRKGRQMGNQPLVLASNGQMPTLIHACAVHGHLLTPTLLILQ